MPELPEVETIRRSLIPHITGRFIEDLDIWRPDILLLRDNRLDWSRSLTMARIIRLDRRGKYLIWRLDGADGELVMTMHLRMTGRCLFFPPLIMAKETSGNRSSLAPHTHLRFRLCEQDGRPAGELRWQDVRRFGRLELFSAAVWHGWHEGVKALGPEPFDSACTAAYLRAQAERHHALSLAAFLLDQKEIAGLGNIYMQEALFRVRLAPQTPAAALSLKQWEELLQAIRGLLAAAIALGGTSFRDYRDANGEKGGYQSYLLVYGREQKPCPNCGAPLQGIRLSGRHLIYCPLCQKTSTQSAC